MISVANLTVEYSVRGKAQERALHGITVTIAEGESVALMGANGSGKSTLARCLNALLLPTAGLVQVDNLDTRKPSHHHDIRRLVGMVFQNPENQIVSTTVEREVAFGLENLGLAYDDMHCRVDSVLRKFDLEHLRHQPPHLLSGGEMQRLALAAVMVMSPKYIVFDEPTSLLDPISRQRLLSLLSALQAESKSKVPSERVAVLFITQYPEEVLSFDRLLVLHRGKLVMDGRPTEIFDRVETLRQFGLSVPVEFEVNHYLRKISDGKFSLNTSDFLPIS